MARRLYFTQSNKDREMKLVIDSLFYFGTSPYINESIKERGPKNRVKYSIKDSGENKGQYGYYIGQHHLSRIYLFMKKNRLKTFIDLGCGAGHIVIALRNLGILADGLEIEKDLVNEAHELMGAGNRSNRKIIRQQDILKLTRNNVRVYISTISTDFFHMSKHKSKRDHDIYKVADVVYFWEPFRDIELSRKFVNRLEKVLVSGQIIIAGHCGSSGDHFRNSTKFIHKGCLGEGSLHIYVVK
jgi:SAM-dependent methyltransferase